MLHFRPLLLEIQRQSRVASLRWPSLRELYVDFEASLLAPPRIVVICLHHRFLRMYLFDVSMVLTLPGEV